MLIKDRRIVIKRGLRGKMKTTIEQSPETNPNPVLNVEKNGTVLYSNEAGKPLLREWGVEIGEKLTSLIRDIVQRVISLDSPEKMEVKVDERVYLVIFHPLPEQGYVNISGFDISDQKKHEEKLLKSEDKYHTLLNSIDQGFFLIDVIFDENDHPVDLFYVESNAAATSMLGKDFAGKRLREIDPDYESYWYDIFGNVAKTGQSMRMEQYAAPDKKWYSFHVFRVGGSDSRRIGNLFLDITERKHREVNFAFLAEINEDFAHLSSLDEVMQTVGEKVGKQLKVKTFNVCEIDEPAGKVAVDFGWQDAGVPSWLHQTFCMSDYLNEEFVRASRTGETIVIRDTQTDPRTNARAYAALEIGSAMTSSFQVKGEWKAFLSVTDKSPRNWRQDEIELFQELSNRVFPLIERTRAEEALRESKSRLKVAEAVDIERRRFFDVLETLPVMIALLTPDRHIAFANRCFRERFGEFRARKCYEYCFGRTVACELCEAYKVLETGQPHHWELKMPDGSAFDVYNLPFTDVDGSPLILEMNIDITERKKAEEKLRDSEDKYRNIVETANEVILITDKESVITYTNPKITDMLGYTQKEIIGKPIWGFISEDYRPVVKLHLEKRRQGISESYELKLIRKDGTPIWTFLNAKPLFDREGGFTGVVSMLTDITKRKKAEEALINIETARKKEIHHRIKNNLQVISSLLDLQAEQFRSRENIKDSEVLKAFRESQDRVISMALIHEELYRGGGFETLNFSPYIKELTENLLLTYGLGSTDVSLNMGLDENLLFDMDTAVPLGMIINELVSNSLKHAFPGREKGEIRIKLHSGEKGKCIENVTEHCKTVSYILSVSDNGVGIPENLDIENLDSLGFQLITSLVDQLDGEFELKRNNGTEFTMRFKAFQKDDMAHPEVLE